MKSPAFSWYVRDWLCSPTVRELHRRKDRSVAAYFFLLNEAWIQEPPASLPNDADALADLARVTREEFDAFWPVMSTQFESDGNGRLFNPRQVQEYRKQTHRADAAAQREQRKREALAQIEHSSSTNEAQNVARPLKTKTKTKTKTPERRDT
jgi:uncharacterized protein YdaU (DUF1376 family)